MKKIYLTAILIALILITIGYFLHYEISLDDTLVGKVLEHGHLTMAQSKSIDAILSLAHLLIGWAIAMMGGVAYLFKFYTEDKAKFNEIDLFLSMLVILLCVISIYFGHLGIDNVTVMLSNDQFPIGDQFIRNCFSRQYLVLLAALGLFGIKFVLYHGWSMATNQSDNG